VIIISAKEDVFFSICLFVCLLVGLPKNYHPIFAKFGENGQRRNS